MTTPHLSCPVAVHATVTCRAAGIGTLRERPYRVPRRCRHDSFAMPTSTRSLVSALSRRRWPRLGQSPGNPRAGASDRFAVVAAPCSAGRPVSARTLVNLREGGPVTVSPHVVPQCSLHAVASAVSVGLRIHGPNIGVGGGPEALSEAFVTALSLLDEPGVEGCWLVLTAWDEEPELDDRGDVPGGAVCRGVALALDRAATGSLRLSLRIVPRMAVIDGTATSAPTDHPSLAALAILLDQAGRAGGPDRLGDCDGCLWSLRLGWGAMVNLDLALAARERRRIAA